MAHFFSVVDITIYSDICTKIKEHPASRVSENILIKCNIIRQVYVFLSFILDLALPKGDLVFLFG